MAGVLGKSLACDLYPAPGQWYAIALQPNADLAAQACALKLQTRS